MARMLSPKWAALMSSWKPVGKSVRSSSNAMGPSVVHEEISRPSSREILWCSSSTRPSGRLSMGMASVVERSSTSYRMPVPVVTAAPQEAVCAAMRLSNDRARCRWKSIKSEALGAAFAGGSGKRSSAQPDQQTERKRHPTNLDAQGVTRIGFLAPVFIRLRVRPLECPQKFPGAVHEDGP